MDRIRSSWNSISDSEASTFLQSTGGREAESLTMLLDLIQKRALSQASFSLLDLGCGNGNLLSLLKGRGVDVKFCGIDFSAPLISQARTRHPDAEFLIGDVQSPFMGSESQNRHFDVVVFSHVIEMLESPELALRSAAAISKSVLIEFFEPPSNEPDTCELRIMDFGNGDVPYLRRKISIATYQTWMYCAGFSHADRYLTSGKYELHELHPC